MSIKIAKKSFAVESGGQRTEVIEGSLFSSDHHAVQARPKDFAKASEDDIAKAVAKARGE
jgi:hypothetical protein